MEGRPPGAPLVGGAGPAEPSRRAAEPFGEGEPRAAGNEPVQLRLAAERVLAVADGLRVDVVGRVHQLPFRFQKA